MPCFKNIVLIIPPKGSRKKFLAWKNMKPLIKNILKLNTYIQNLAFVVNYFTNEKKRTYKL